MKSSKNDLRVRMTKAMLRQALAELMRAQPIQTITVSELCEKAAINRSTFYAHYNDIYDLLENIEETIFIELQETLKQGVFNPESWGHQVPRFMKVLFEFLQRNSDMCIVLLCENSDRRFVARLLNSFRDRSIAEYEQAYPKAERREIELFYTYVVSGCMGLLEHWFENGMLESPTEMATISSRLIAGGASFLK